MTVPAKVMVKLSKASVEQSQCGRDSTGGAVSLARQGSKCWAVQHGQPAFWACYCNKVCSHILRGAHELSDTQ